MELTSHIYLIGDLPDACVRTGKFGAESARPRAGARLNAVISSWSRPAHNAGPLTARTTTRTQGLAEASATTVASRVGIAPDRALRR